jgi:hypothetical protein
MCQDSRLLACTLPVYVHVVLSCVFYQLHDCWHAATLNLADVRLVLEINNMPQGIQSVQLIQRSLDSTVCHHALNHAIHVSCLIRIASDQVARPHCQAHTCLVNRKGMCLHCKAVSVC